LGKRRNPAGAIGGGQKPERENHEEAKVVAGSRSEMGWQVEENK
jgi:hypothetical protein